MKEAGVHRASGALALTAAVTYYVSSWTISLILHFSRLWPICLARFSFCQIAAVLGMSIAVGG